MGTAISMGGILVTVEMLSAYQWQHRRCDIVLLFVQDVTIGENWVRALSALLLTTAWEHTVISDGTGSMWKIRLDTAEERINEL